MVKIRRLLKIILTLLLVDIFSFHSSKGDAASFRKHEYEPEGIWPPTLLENFPNEAYYDVPTLDELPSFMPDLSGLDTDILWLSNPAESRVPGQFMSITALKKLLMKRAERGNRTMHQNQQPLT